MKLNASDTVWAPHDQPQYLLVLRHGEAIPQNANQFLAIHERMLERLKEDSNEDEIELANYTLRHYLESEVRDWLPTDLFDNPQTLGLLMRLPLAEGSPFHEWKTSVEEALREPRMPDNEAIEEAGYLTFETRIDQMINP